jgi:SAM-dependent methyltransferase
MDSSLIFEIFHELGRENPGRAEFTRRAFEMIPPMDHPRILDIGSGSGAPTLELGRLSDGPIVALDQHRPHLERLRERARQAGFSQRIHVVQGSMLQMSFPGRSFDVLWAEGSIYVIGFERGLRQWRSLLRAGGCLAVHEAVWLRDDPPEPAWNFWQRAYPSMTTVGENLKIIERCGYELLGHFRLPPDAWWDEYYRPLDARLELLRDKYAIQADALETLAEQQLEIDLYREYADFYGSAFFVMRRPPRSDSASTGR